MQNIYSHIKNWVQTEEGEFLAREGGTMYDFHDSTKHFEILNRNTGY